MVLSNVGPQPFGRVTLTQDLVDTGGFSSALVSGSGSTRSAFHSRLRKAA